MNIRSPRVFLPLLAGITLVAVAFVSQAQPPGAGRGSHGDHAGHSGFGPPHGGHAGFGPPNGGQARLFRAFHELDLTDAQKEQLHATLEGQQEAIKTNGEALHGAQQALQQLALSEGYDETQAAVLAQAVGNAMAETAKLHARLVHEAYGVLTPEQRTTLAESLAKPASDSPGHGGHRRHHRH